MPSGEAGSARIGTELVPEAVSPCVSLQIIPMPRPAEVAGPG